MSEPKKNGPVQVNPAGACLQLGGDGLIRPVGTHTDNFGTSANPAASVVRRPAPLVPPTDSELIRTADEVSRVSAAVPQKRVMATDSHLVLGFGDTRGVVKAAKARIRELKAFMRQAAKAKKELTELERLVAAATGKPLAAVRDIRRSAG